MISLLKYELKQSFAKIFSITIFVVIFTYIPEILHSNMLGLQKTIILIGFLSVLFIKISHLIKNTLTDYKEHMMLIPKSTSKIIGANAIVVIMYSIIFTAIYFSILNASIMHKLLNGFVCVNICFLIYIVVTFIYIISIQLSKKTVVIHNKPIFIISFLSIVITFYTTLKISIHFIILSFTLMVILYVMGIICINSIFDYTKNYKTRVLIILLLCISFVNTGLINHSYNSRIVEDTQLTFIDDPRIIGVWEKVDSTDEYKNYIPNDDNKKDYQEKYLTFNENGVISERHMSSWTNGFVTNFPMKETKSEYVMKQIDDETYLFIQWKSGDYVYRHTEPFYFVLKKIS